ncbi:MAG: NAD-dependent epimerase/dehydratase family protein [Bacteroidota bacterium]
MKVIVTGVAGFIGSNLVRRLLAEGIEVTGIDNFSYGFRENLEDVLKNNSFHFIEADLCDKSILKFENADVICHLASLKIPRYGNAYNTLDQNVSMIRNIVRFAIDKKARLIFASTSDVYGKNPALPFSEDSDLVYGAPGVHRWIYAQSKLFGEQLMSAAHQDFGLEYAAARIFSSYGPFQHPEWWGGPQSVFIDKSFKKEPIPLHGDGLQKRTFTYVDDTVEALYKMAVCDKSVNEIINVGSGIENEISILALAEKIWKLIHGLDAEVPFEYIPYETFGRYEDVRSRVPDTAKLKSLLNVQCTTALDEGLQRTISWHRKRYGL